MIKKCLFPAAGYGTRFLPATKAMPKEMLPLVDKPLIQYGVEEAMCANIRQIAIVTGRGKRAIEDHFDNNYELESQLNGSSKECLLKDIKRIVEECTFSYTRQNQMLGLGDAVLKGETLVGNEPFAVILSDDVCIGKDNTHCTLKEMIEVYKKYKCSVVLVEEVPIEDISRYGIVSGKSVENGITKVDNMVEKPSPEDAPSNLGIIGRYILTPDIFDILRDTKPDSKGEVQLTDAILEQAKKGKVVAYKLEGKRFDCGSMHGFVKATNYFYDLREKGQK